MTCVDTGKVGPSREILCQNKQYPLKNEQRGIMSELDGDSPFSVAFSFNVYWAFRGVGPMFLPGVYPGSLDVCAGFHKCLR